MNYSIDQRLREIFKPYQRRGQTVSDATAVIEDLRITGSDYIDLVQEIETIFSISLTDFIIGPEPQYIRPGIEGALLGKDLPVFRDFTLGDIRKYLEGIG